MSMILMAKAMQVKTGSAIKKLILLKLADNANDKGECWPSYQYIADQCELSRRSVINNINALCEQGLVKKIIRPGKTRNLSNVYILTLENGSKITKQNDDKEGSPGSAINASYGATDACCIDATDAPEPVTLLEPVNEPNTPLTPQEAEGGKLAKPKKRKTKTLDYDEFLNAYNDEVGERLPHAVEANTKRKTRLKKIVSLLATPNIDGWRAYVRAFVEMAKPFYFGENNTGWTADIDYLLRETTLTGVREGKFADRGY